MRKLFLLFWALFATTALWAYDFQSGDLYYNITSDTTVEVTCQSTSYPYNEGVTFTTVTIPETVTYNGTTYTVTSIGDYAFYECTSLTSITIPNSVTSIGDYAFRSCSSLTSLAIPNSVTSIGKYAFDNCSSLTSVTIPNSVTSIGDGAFSGCSSLTSMVVEEANTAYDSRENCNAIIETATNTLIAGCHNTIIPNSVTSIGERAFQDCSSLISITIPNSVTSIGDFAFFYCSSLTSITIPNTVTSIGKYAFVVCSSLTSVTIPNSVTSIGFSAFRDCSSLTSMVVEESNTTYDSRDNCNAIIETATNTLIAGCQNTIIPNSVTSIEDYVFCNCSSLTSITIPNTVTSIGKYAFRDCSSLTSVTLNSNDIVSKETYMYYIFGSQVEEYVIGDSVTSIGDYAFRSCSSLTSVTIPNSVTSIGNEAFAGCSSLNFVTLTAPSVEAFCNGQGNRLLSNAGCHVSRKIAINGEIITSITIPNSVTSIGEYAFYECTSLTSITIPNSVTSIGNEAFAGCSSLTSIILTGSTIESFCQSTTNKQLYNAGVHCYRKIELNNQEINDLIIPNSVTSIEDYAFYNCSSLNSIRVEATRPPQLGCGAVSASICYIPCGTSIPYKVSDWAQCVDEFVEVGCDQCGDDLRWEYDGTQLSITGYGEMYDYDIDPQPWQESRNKITQLSLPDGMTSVGAAAFADCKFLNNATIPSSVKEIRYSAFEDCRSLSSLTFAEPSALTSIGNWAFYNCHKLQHVTIPEGVTEIGEAAFFDCTYLDELTLPASMEYIADNGFALCAKLRRMNVNATTPPQVEARTFEDVDRTIPVVVPDESVSVYKSAPVWQEFNIVGKSEVPAALDNIPAENSATRKLLRDGNLVIIRDGVEYNVMGQEL